MIDMSNSATTNGYHRSCSPSAMSGSSSPNLLITGTKGSMAPNANKSSVTNGNSNNGNQASINRGGGMRNVVMPNSHANMVWNI